MKLLHIIASPRGENSRTLSISREFLAGFQARHPGVEIEELDLFNLDLPPYTGSTADAKYILMAGGALDEATQEAWERITATTTHFLSFDLYLVTSPMWNFGIPYQLKHYIDVIVQAGFCFQFTETGPIGMANGKKMICITSRGSDYGAGSPIEALDFQEPYLRAIFGFIGIEDITFINAQPLDIAPDLTTANVQEAKEEARQLAQSLALPEAFSGDLTAAEVQEARAEAKQRVQNQAKTEAVAAD